MFNSSGLKSELHLQSERRITMMLATCEASATNLNHLPESSSVRTEFLTQVMAAGCF